MTRPRRDRAARAALLALSGLVGAGCYVNTQRHPAPMRAGVEPLPPGTTELHPEGPEEVLVVRISDPVHVQRPGEASSYPLYFFRKQARMNAGSWVFAGAGGRLEVLYSDNSSITLYGLGSGVVGSPSRQEPIFSLMQVTRARIQLESRWQVRLLGGAVLESATGPFVVEAAEEGILRVRNRSKGEGRVAYREAVFSIDPGEVLDLPLLDSGTGPLEVHPGFQTISGPGMPIDLRGELDVVQSDRDQVRLRASGEHEVRAFGLRVRLDPGDDLVLRSLGAPARREPAPEAAEDAPEDAPDPDAEDGP